MRGPDQGPPTGGTSSLGEAEVHTDRPVLGRHEVEGRENQQAPEVTPGRAQEVLQEVPLDSGLEMKVHPMERGRDWHPGRAHRTGQGTGHREQDVSRKPCGSQGV